MSHRYSMNVLILLFLCACGTVRPRVEVRLPGPMDITAAKKVARQAVERADPNEIAVYDADAANPAVNPVLDANKYEMLGSVSVHELSNGVLSLRNAFWYNDFESRGRFGYCVWQMPLKILTLSVWNALPLAWPCFAGNPSDPEDRLAYLSSYARRVAAELGGDTVLLTQAHGTRHFSSHGIAFNPVPGLYVPVATSTTTSIEENTGATFVIYRRRVPAGK